jgi:hypothetical protein
MSYKKWAALLVGAAALWLALVLTQGSEPTDLGPGIGPSITPTASP